MNKLAPVTRRVLIAKFKKLGFDGPFSGGKHAFMSRDSIDVRIPNPHVGDISADLLVRILQQAGVTRQEWMSV